MITSPSKIKEVQGQLRLAAGKIAPLWSLENFVAVNPYMGFTEHRFADAMDFLNKCNQANATLPVSFYSEAIASGFMTHADIANALKETNIEVEGVSDVPSFLELSEKISRKGDQPHIYTLSDIASEINGKKWQRFMVDHISHWAAAYFDDKQALWNSTDKSKSLFQSWKREAEIDFGTEAMGLRGFRKFIKSLPIDYSEAATVALSELNIPDQMLEHYLSALLMKMNGWAGFVARIDWDARLGNMKSNLTEEFLSVLLVWELCLLKLLKYPELGQVWSQAKIRNEFLCKSSKLSDDLAMRLILQQAFDYATQRNLIDKINSHQPAEKSKSVAIAQVAFCIDVRSEVFRRKLETVQPHIETLGFAGFFGFPIKFVPLGQEEGANQCPVLLAPSYTVKERLKTPELEAKALKNRSIYAHIMRAWKAFKSGAISCFGFVSPLGIYFLPKIITDSFSMTRTVPKPETFGLSGKEVKDLTVGVASEEDFTQFTGIPVDHRISLAESMLKGMSLTENFAPLVVIAGHGSDTTNNPHGTGLDCGACGGHSGAPNAKVAAAVLNDPLVRKGLESRGLMIPQSTLFIAALHNTTTDEVVLFADKESLPEFQMSHFNKLESALREAGKLTRLERSLRMKISDEDVDKKIIQRSRDWSQVRPEWGLAGCSSFIVAPRERTAHLDLGGKAFMHNYSWQKDQDFKVLETIMTAPIVVTSWINLQYFASTVDNKRFGAGNKTLHNVVGGVGVLEGFAGDLRVGLPIQSVHDGEKYQHQPQRLNVIIEAPIDEMSKILSRHPSVKNLCDNEWIFLFAMNEHGKVAYKYVGNLEWELL